MAITKISEPTVKFNPVYNPLVYIVYSEDYRNVGFNYVFYIYEQTVDVDSLPIEVLITKLKVKPDANGQGVLSLNRILQDYVSYDFKPELDYEALKPYNSILSYKVVVKEEYHLDYNFDYIGVYDEWEDTVGVPTTANFLYSGGGDIEPKFKPGDEIEIIFDNPVKNVLGQTYTDVVELNGLPKVLNDFSRTKVKVLTVDFLDTYGWCVFVGNRFQESGVTIDPLGGGWMDKGLIRLKDRKKVVPGAVFQRTGVVFNGYFEPMKYNKVNLHDYNIAYGGPNKKMLTTIPDKFVVRPGSTMLINAYNSSSDVHKMRIDVTNGVTSDSTYIYGFEYGVDANQFNVGMNNSNIKSLIEGMSGNVKGYEFVLLNEDDFENSKKYSVIIDKSCPHTKNIEICFLDSLGSFIPFNFSLRNEESIQITKEEVTNKIGLMTEEFQSKFQYDLIHGGREVYNGSYKRAFKLRTAFLNVTMSEYFQELIKSPVTFINLDGTFVKCIVSTSSVTIKGEKWFELKRYEIDVELSLEGKMNI